MHSNKDVGQHHIFFMTHTSMHIDALISRGWSLTVSNLIWLVLVLKLVSIQRNEHFLHIYVTKEALAAQHIHVYMLKRWLQYSRTYAKLVEQRWQCRVFIFFGTSYIWFIVRNANVFQASHKPILFDFFYIFYNVYMCKMCTDVPHPCKCWTFD